jgi:hypothetical protein
MNRSVRVLPDILLILTAATPFVVSAEELSSTPAATVLGESPWAYNPAILGAREDGIWSFDLVRASASVRNNTFDLDLYEEYNGAFLTDEDKQKILDRMSGGQSKVTADVASEALSFRRGNVGFSVRSFAGGHGGLDKDFADLVFYGNELDRTYQFFNEGSILAYTSFGLSYGRPAGMLADWDVSLGAAIRYVVGLGAAEVVESRGETVTEITGIDGWTETLIRRSEGTGSSVAFDFGVWALRERWELGLALNNLGPAVSWDDAEEQYFFLEFENWTFQDETEEDGHAYTKEDTTISIRAWTMPLPTRLRTMAAYHTDWGHVHLLWLQGLRSVAGITTTPRVLIGTEWNAQTWLKPRLQLEIGSPEGFSIASGLGIAPSFFRLDLAVTNFRFPPMKSKGLGFSLGLGFGAG